MNFVIQNENALSKLLDEVYKLSLFDLRQLNDVVYALLDDPQRILSVKKQLRIGMDITYFCRETNSQVRAVILEIRKTQTLVENMIDKRKWNIYFSSIILNNQTPFIANQNQHKKGTLNRHSLHVGAHVGYTSKYGQDVFGTVEKLNPKRAIVVLNNGERWNVRYGSLFLVTDGVSVDNNGHLLIHGEVIQEHHSGTNPLILEQS